MNRHPPSIRGWIAIPGRRGGPRGRAIRGRFPPEIVNLRAAVTFDLSMEGKHREVRRSLGVGCLLRSPAGVGRRGGHMRCVMLTVALLAVGVTSPQFAADDDEQTADDAPLDVETILANPLDEDAYRRSRHCISARSYDGVEIIDERTLVFHGRRGIWLNRLSGRCRGLTRDMIPTMGLRSGRVCEFDRFRGRSRSGFPDSMSCTLGRFEQIDEAQVESVRAARVVRLGSER